MDIQPDTNPLQDAIEYAGNATRLSKLLGISQQAVSEWVQAGRIPPRQALAVEEATAGKISRHRIWDFYYGPMTS